MILHHFRILFLAAALLLAVPALSTSYFDFNSNCREAYTAILQWRLQAGEELLQKEKQSHPDNLVVPFLENYIDFFILFFDEDPLEYDKRIKGLTQRLARLEAGPRLSPFYLYCQSVCNLQGSLIKIKFDQRWSAAWQFRRAFLQIKDNQKKFPAFVPNQMLMGAMQTVVGTIPDGYKWIGSVLGMEGSIRAGMKQMEGFLKGQNEYALLFRTEAIFYNAYLQFYILNKTEEVFQWINSCHPDLVNNHLLAFMQANLALNSRHAALALETINRRNPSSAYYPFRFWNFETGCALLYKLDEQAIPFFEKFVNGFRGRFYLKDAYHKLSWLYYLKGNTKMAEEYRTKVLQLGYTDTESDKNAMHEARVEIHPDPVLLKTRLLNDGGYSAEALQLISRKSAEDFAPGADRLAYYYWLARVYDELKRKEEALVSYRYAIDLGEKRTEYFAARSALQTGFIYEKKGDTAAAVYWFKRCISMKNHEFENAIEQKAKAALLRCHR